MYDIKAQYNTNSRSKFTLKLHLVRGTIHATGIGCVSRWGVRLSITFDYWTADEHKSQTIYVLARDYTRNYVSFQVMFRSGNKGAEEKTKEIILILMYPVRILHDNQDEALNLHFTKFQRRYLVPIPKNRQRTIVLCQTPP